MSALTTNRQTSKADEKTGNQHSRTGTPGASVRVSAALHEFGSVHYSDPFGIALGCTKSVCC